MGYTASSLKVFKEKMSTNLVLKINQHFIGDNSREEAIDRAVRCGKREESKKGEMHLCKNKFNSLAGVCNLCRQLMENRLQRGFKAGL